MSEVKEILNELPEEEAASTEETIESVEETVEQVEEAVETEVILEDEEAEEEDETVLAEQDLLDGEEDEELADDAPAYEETPPSYEELAADNQKLRRTNKITTITSAVAAFLALIFLGGMIGVIVANGESKPFTGLVIGKNYKANVQLGDYSALTYSNTYAAPTEAELMDEIHSKMSSEHKTESDVTDALISGDTTNITFDGYIDGEIYENACAENYDLTLGSDAFIPGFEDGLIGKKVGESVTLNLTFPADYSEESLQNKDVRFEVKINSAKRTTYAELTDAIVKELSEDKYTTVADYKNAIYAELDDTAKSNAESNGKNEIWQTLLETSKLKKYPQNMYDSIVEDTDELYSGYYSTYASYGVTDLESFVEIVMGSELVPYIETQISYHYITYAIAAEQGITLTDADYEEMLTQAGLSSREELEEKYAEDFWRLESDALYNKVTTFLYENATAK